MSRQRSRIGEESVRAKTGRGWKEWFSLLDAWGAQERGHAPTAQHLEEAHDVSGWWAQTITVEYERVRGLREVGQRGEEFVVTVQRTIRVSPEAAYAALTEPDHLSRWFTQDARADLRIGGRYEKTRMETEVSSFASTLLDGSDTPGRTQAMRPEPLSTSGLTLRPKRNL